MYICIFFLSNLFSFTVLPGVTVFVMAIELEGQKDQLHERAEYKKNNRKNIFKDFKKTIF